MIDFSGKRWWYLGISLVLFLIAAGVLAFPPRLQPGIEFTSGSSFTLEFNDKDPGQDGLSQAMKDLGYPEARIQTSSLGYLVRTRELQGAPNLTDATTVGPQDVQLGEFDKIKTGLQTRFGDLQVVDFSTVSSTISTQIAQNADDRRRWQLPVAIALYIWASFRSGCLAPGAMGPAPSSPSCTMPSSSSACSQSWARCSARRWIPVSSPPS